MHTHTLCHTWTHTHTHTKGQITPLCDLRIRTDMQSFQNLARHRCSLQRNASSRPWLVEQGEGTPPVVPDWLSRGTERLQSSLIGRGAVFDWSMVKQGREPVQCLVAFFPTASHNDKTNAPRRDQSALFLVLSVFAFDGADSALRFSIFSYYNF